MKLSIMKLLRLTKEVIEMKKYIVIYENREMWNTENDINNDCLWVVDEREIKRLAVEWGVDVDELMSQVEEI